MQLLWLQSDRRLWRLLLWPLSLLCLKLDHRVLGGHQVLYNLYNRKDLFLPLHLHRFARIQWVLELLLRLYMRHQNFPLLLRLLFDPLVLEL